MTEASHSFSANRDRKLAVTRQKRQAARGTHAVERLLDGTKHATMNDELREG
jgi:hypothetical protein